MGVLNYLYRLANSVAEYNVRAWVIRLFPPRLGTRVDIYYCGQSYKALNLVLQRNDQAKTQGTETWQGCGAVGLLIVAEYCH